MLDLDRAATLAECSKIAEQAARYEGASTNREASLAFSLLRVLAVNVAALGEPREVTLHGYACADGCPTTVKGKV